MAAGSDLLTVTEAAEALKSSGQSVRNWIRAGKLPAVKINRHFCVRQSDLDRILEAGATSEASGEFWEDPDAQSFQPPVRRN